MLADGSILGAYRIIRRLGQGGMGCVYEAEHMALRVRRALKVFGTESSHAAFLRKRFLAEGRILANLRHPRIVRVSDFNIDPATDVPYFAMDLVLSPSGEPRTLEDACREGADESQIAGWFRDVCEGLDYIHSEGVVHRDISLDNILIGRDGRAVITDFGIAKITGEAWRRQIDITRTMPMKDGSCLNWGKGLYMAPEIRKGGEATPASDAYALGVLLFRVLAGSWYTADVRLEDALAGFDTYNWPEVIARLCAKDPSARLPQDGLAGTAALLRAAAPPRPPRRFARAIVFAALLAGVLALGLVTVRAVRAPDSPPVPTESSVVSSPVFHIVDVTNRIPQTVYHVVDVTNVVRQTVYEIVSVTNHVGGSAPAK